jgi:glutamine synthetase type III
VDQNIVVMQILEEVAAQFGLAALLQEKPFNNVNGSGKHNNWSIGTTDTGLNLLNPQALEKACGNADVFPMLMAAILSAVDDHGDLMCVLRSQRPPSERPFERARQGNLSEHLAEPPTDLQEHRQSALLQSRNAPL